VSYQPQRPEDRQAAEFLEDKVSDAERDDDRVETIPPVWEIPLTAEAETLEGGLCNEDAGETLFQTN